MANKKPASSVGASKPDTKGGNKVAPTTKAPKQAGSHAGHGHKGKA